jgi:uncharacterized protein with GYD domain
VSAARRVAIEEDFSWLRLLCLLVSRIRASATLRKRSAGRRPSRRWLRRAASLKDLYWTLGRYDVIAVCEGPDDEAATALSLSVSSRGNVRSQTLRAFSFDEMKLILGKMV